MSASRPADEVWQALATLVFDNRDGWRRAVVERTGLPFSRVRVLRRLSRSPMTVTELANGTAVDAPAATVAVNDLQDRGLVERRVDPANRRAKLVSLTDAGRAMVTAMGSIPDPAPAGLSALTTEDLDTLRTILAKIGTL